MLQNDIVDFFDYDYELELPEDDILSPEELRVGSYLLRTPTYIKAHKSVLHKLVSAGIAESVQDGQYLRGPKWLAYYYNY